MDTMQQKDPLVVFAEKHSGHIWSDTDLAKSVLSRLTAPKAKALRKVSTGSPIPIRPSAPPTKPAPAPVSKTHRIGRFSDDSPGAKLAPEHANVRDFPQTGDVVQHSSGAQWRVNRIEGGSVHLVDHLKPGKETAIPYAKWKNAHNSGSLVLGGKSKAPAPEKGNEPTELVRSLEEEDDVSVPTLTNDNQSIASLPDSDAKVFSDDIDVDVDYDDGEDTVAIVNRTQVIAKSYADNEHCWYPLDTPEQIEQSWFEFHAGGENDYDTTTGVIVKSAIAVAARRRGIALAPGGGVYTFSPGTELSGILFPGDRPFVARVLSKSGTTLLLEKNPDGSRKSVFQMAEQDLARLVSTDLMSVVKSIDVYDVPVSNTLCRRCGSSNVTLAPNTGYCDDCLRNDFSKIIAKGW